MSEVEKAAKNILLVDTGDGESLEESDPQIRDAIRDMAKILGFDVVEGPIVPCETCGYYECVCEVQKTHAADCHYRRAMEMKIAIGCTIHGEDVCPECDKCDCSKSDVPRR